MSLFTTLLANAPRFIESNGVGYAPIVHAHFSQYPKLLVSFVQGDDWTALSIYTGNPYDPEGGEIVAFLTQTQMTQLADALNTELARIDAS